MDQQQLANLAHLRRARDLVDREYARPLDVPTMARKALMSPGHFSRAFRAAYGETPYSYLMTRRVERAMALLRGGMSVTEACMTVGCTSLGSFSSRFTELVGMTPSAYRAGEHLAVTAMPGCVAMMHTRPTRDQAGRSQSAQGQAAAGESAEAAEERSQVQPAAGRPLVDQPVRIEEAVGAGSV